jgi:hypothetical protein
MVLIPSESKLMTLSSNGSRLKGPHSMLIYSQVRQSNLQVSRFHDPQAVKMRFVKIIASP